ncbi:MAG: sugar ABC transporter permease [Holosporales bacterium]|nr:sugar ABC transporter permease [Holosporales bacterium]
MSSKVRRYLSKYSALKAWLFLFPCLAVIVLAGAWPLFRTFSLSFTDAALDSLSSGAFVGVGNFCDLFEDPDWWVAVKNTLFFAVVSVSLEAILGFCVAFVLHRSLRFKTVLRAIVLIPWAIPTVVSAKIWGWMFHDVYGVINRVLEVIGVLSSPVSWVASSELTMVAIIIVDVWKTTPFMALLLLAGLQSISSECFEAAKIDGVSTWRLIWHIVLPMLKPTFVVALIFRTLDALRIFDLVYILGSGDLSCATMSVYTRRYLIDFGEVGRGSSAATMLFFTVAMVSVLYFTVGQRNLRKAS